MLFLNIADGVNTSMCSHLQYTGYKNKIKLEGDFLWFGSVCSSQSHDKTLMSTIEQIYSFVQSVHPDMNCFPLVLSWEDS